MPSDQVLLDAAHPAYASVYASEYEELGGRFPAGAHIEDEVPRLDDDVQLPIIKKYIKELEAKWGYSIDEILEAMDIDHPDDQSDVIYLLLMENMGHGISVHDDWEEAWEDLEDELGPLESSPGISLDTSEWYDLAYENAEDDLEDEEDE